jgi:hypothetical protein
MLGTTPNFSPSVWLTIGSEISSWGNVQKYLCKAIDVFRCEASVRVHPACPNIRRPARTGSHHKDDRSRKAAR